MAGWTGFARVRRREAMPQQLSMQEAERLARAEALRGGNEARKREVGKLFVFDDTVEHEARTAETDCVVLIVDSWWQLSVDERRVVAAIAESIDR